MPRSPLHALIWSPDQGFYELYTQGQLEQRFRPANEAAWLAWLGEVTSFAFQGAAGSLNVYQEARGRAGQYWYAYHTTGSRTRKRYLGRTARVTLGRLEETAQALSREPAPTPLAVSPRWREIEQSTTLLSTKLSAPRLPNSLVQRERLLAELEGALSTPLTLLSASAGWGKTTLLSVWVSLHPHQVAWLSLDSLDNEPFRFWAAVIAALRKCRPGVGSVALAMVHSQEPPPFSAILTALLNDLAEVGEPAAPLVLLLDDYQVIEDPVIHETVTFWGEHLPAHVHLLLSSRVDPDLPLPRLRLRGQLLEIRTADLRFRPEEASLFLRQTMGLSLSQEEVATLEKRTEGWVAGLQVAALSLRKQQDRVAWISAFTGSHRYLLDYVQQEILLLQPEPIRRFLLQVAVLTRMNAAVCQAVTGEPASQDLLETLERSNLFVVPLDEQRQWYRLHDLFREALLVQGQARQPDLVPRLHLRAARWYEAQGELREAIAHALAAGDFLYAASLIERAAASLWLSGEAQTVLTWLVALPDAVLSSHTRLALNAVLHLLESLLMAVRASYVQPLALVEQVLGRVETLLQRQEESTSRSEVGEPVPALPDAEVTMVRRRLHLLRVLLAARTMALRLNEEGMRHLVKEIEGLDEQEEVSWKMIGLFLTFWLVESLQWEGALLINRLLEVKREALEAEDHRALVRVMEWLAFAYVRAGRLRLAHRECLEGLALAEQIGVHTPMSAYLHYCLANTYYAWNRLEEATRAEQQMLHIGQTWQNADLLVCGHLALAQLELARGALDAADQALRLTEALIQQEQLVIYAFWVEAARVQYWLAAGDLEAARHWAEQVAFSPDTWDPNHKGAFLMQVRVFLAQQQYPQAIEALEHFRALLDRPADIETTIQFLALQVIALHDGGKQEQVQAVAARLLSLTEPEGNIRVFLDLGAPMKQVLQTLQAAPNAQSEPAYRAPTHSRSFVAKLLAAFEQEEQQRTNRAGTSLAIPEEARLPIQARASSPAQPGLYEPLSRQEQRVLQLLVAGRTYAEMAEALIVSLNTIKTQVSSIYRKLGVSRRAEAIAAAQQWPLLSPLVGEQASTQPSHPRQDNHPSNHEHR
jgi:LuxR family maltose regulon positive regulatory protein